MISAAELILTNRGSIYHLDLRPDEIADTVFTVGDPARVDMVSRYFDTVDVKQAHREFVTHTGTLHGKPVSVISTGIGPDNIDIVITELDALVNIDFETRQSKSTHRQLNIVRIGTSGSLQRDIDVDSFVASEAAIGIDNLLFFYDYQSDNIALVEDFNHHLLNHIGTKAYHYNGDKTLLQQYGSEVHQGITVTCPGFYGPQGRRLRVGPKDPTFIDRLQSWNHNGHRVINFEMETSGIYGMSRLLGHRALSLSAIVANRPAGTFSANAAATVDKLIQNTLEKF